MAGTAAQVRAALREALELYAYESTHSDGRLIVDPHTGKPRSIGAQWVYNARIALSLDPLTGKRPPRKRY